MAEVHDRGRRGERLAAGYLEDRGWEILERNWRAGPLEIDLIARSEGVVAFVEVKTRTAGSGGHPLEAIGARKRRDVIRAAARWLASGRGRGQALGDIRFDAVSVVVGGPSAPEVTHVPDAWRLSRSG